MTEIYINIWWLIPAVAFGVLAGGMWTIWMLKDGMPGNGPM